MADTIKILVATDNHVGYNERDPIRGDDSWKTFHEIMCLARERDVDMVLLGGDLFHENVPSRKSMYNVMRSLRMNCLGSKPCELEMLSDGSEHFDPAFDHVNYEDRDINVSIPVFSIHGNHDDPSGEGHFAALDLLAVSGFVNYFGRTPESDNIVIKPVLLQKGRTKLALYGMSNVRDERLYRTFRDGKVKFYQASQQMGDWFHMICVHQNHFAHTETSYLPENFLPDFLDLVIWGHEHECDIQPHVNPEMNFRVMQPGSSVATSLVPGEAVTKHVALMTVTGKDFRSEPIRLKTVRPFVYKDLALSQDKEAVRIARKDSHRTELTRHLMKVVDELIGRAKQEWLEAQEEDQDPEADEPFDCPLPLIRLRVDTAPPDGIGKFDIENPQRFSNRFIDKVANTNDVVQFQMKKKSNMTRATADADADKKILARFESLEGIKVEKLVREFLEAQSLTILPQNYFGDAVSQFVDKDDKHAMELFVNDSLANQIKHLVKLQNDEEDDDEEREDLAAEIDRFRSELEEEFAKGNLKTFRGKVWYKPKPDNWDSDLEGSWEDQPGAVQRAESDLENREDEAEDGAPASRGSTRDRGRGRGGRGAASKAAPVRIAPSSKTKFDTTRGRKRAAEVEEDAADEEDGEEDILMLDDVEDDYDDNSQALFFQDTRNANGNKRNAKTSGTAISGRKPQQTTRATNTRKQPTRTTATSARAKQSTLSFTGSQISMLGKPAGSKGQNVGDDIEDDDDDDDDDDAFEPISKTKTKR